MLPPTALRIGKTIVRMRDGGSDRVESTEDAAQQWSDHVNFVFDSTVISQSARDTRAWTVGANVDGKEKAPLFYFGGVPAYIAAVEKEISEGWPGHTFSNSVKVA